MGRHNVLLSPVVMSRCKKRNQYTLSKPPYWWLHWGKHIHSMLFCFAWCLPGRSTHVGSSWVLEDPWTFHPQLSIRFIVIDTIFSCGEDLKPNQKVIGYAHTNHTPIEMSTSCLPVQYHSALLEICHTEQLQDILSFCFSLPRTTTCLTSGFLLLLSP